MNPGILKAEFLIKILQESMACGVKISLSMEGARGVKLQ
jgi:hypothetical protein